MIQHYKLPILKYPCIIAFFPWDICVITSSSHGGLPCFLQLKKLNPILLISFSWPPYLPDKWASLPCVYNIPSSWPISELYYTITFRLWNQWCCNPRSLRVQMLLVKGKYLIPVFYSNATLSMAIIFSMKSIYSMIRLHVSTYIYLQRAKWSLTTLCIKKVKLLLRKVIVARW